MSLDIGEAIKTGFAKAATVPGAIFAVVILALGLASTLTINSILRTVFLENEAVRQAIEENPEITYEEFTATMEGQIPLDFLDADPLILGGGFVALLIVQFVFTIGVIRWFTEAAEGLHAGLFTRRLLWTVGNLILAMIVFAVILGGIPLIVVAAAALIGGELVALLAGIALIIPLLYVYVALYFYNFEIIVEGANAIDAFGNSWGLTRNNRLMLFFLGAIFVVGSLVLGLVVGTVTAVNPLVNVVSTQVLNAALAVLGIGITAAAYNQLRGAETESVSAAGPDDL